MQLHTSYSSLGRDFKNTFEELVKNLHRQKLEAEQLRQAASSAMAAAIQAENNVSARLNACLSEERSQMAMDRQALLSQITELINKSGENQDARWESRINAVYKDLSTSISSTQAANKAFNDNMDLWSEKEDRLADEVTKSRDTLRSKMKNDWMVIALFSIKQGNANCISRLLTTITLRSR